MRLEECHSDLAELVKGSSFSQLFSLLHILAQVRYADKAQLNTCNFKLATRAKLLKLEHLGYLTCKNKVYSVTSKTIELLKENDYPVSHFTGDLRGEGGKEEICKAAVKLEALKLPDFYRLIYPNFTYLIPDFALVFKRDHQAKLVFVEVETEKPKWNEYLENKRMNYLTLSADHDIWAVWWKVHSTKLNLAWCREDEFSFSVWCVGNFKADWPGWSFGRTALEIHQGLRVPG